MTAFSLLFQPRFVESGLAFAVNAEDDPELAGALAGNQPLPWRDASLASAAIQPEPLPRRRRISIGGSELRVETDPRGAFGLASYIDLDRALGAAVPGPLPGLGPLLVPEDGQRRYTVLSGGWKQATTVAGRRRTRHAVTVGVKSAATKKGWFAVIAAVPPDAPAADQVAPVFSQWALPSAIRGPEDLPAGKAVLAGFQGDLRLTAEAQVGFDLHWLRKVTPRRFGADLGLAVRTPLKASYDLRASGSFLAAVSRDETGWLRLRLFRHSSRQSLGTAGFAVSARPSLGHHERFDELIAALLGVHEGQWFHQVFEMAGADRISQALAGLDSARVRSFLDVWRGLDGKLAQEVWRLAADSGALAAFKRWSEELRAGVNAIIEAGEPAVPIALAGVAALPPETREAVEQWLARLQRSTSESDWLQRLHTQSDALAALLAPGPLHDTFLSLRHHASEALGLDRLEAALARWDGFENLDPWAREQIGQLFQGVLTPEHFATAQAGLESLVALRDRIHEQAIPALERQLRIDLAWRFERLDSEQALFDCSFAFTGEGLAAYRKALEGDLSGAIGDGPHIRLHSCALGQTLWQRSDLELHLPFLDRKDWRHELHAAATFQVEADESGRLFVYTVDASDRLGYRNTYESALALSGGFWIGRGQSAASFGLNYSDTRVLTARQVRSLLLPVVEAYGFGAACRRHLNDVGSQQKTRWEASLHVSTPGQYVEAWLTAPAERARQFQPVYSKISAAVQIALRRWLPYAYFGDPARYKDLLAAYPLIIWSLSAPRQGRERYELTYDVMNRSHMERLVATALPRLPEEMKMIAETLTELGEKKSARFYARRDPTPMVQAVLDQPRQLLSLMAADSSLVNDIVRLGIEGNRTAAELEKDPAEALRHLTRFSAKFVQTFHIRLRRLYGGREFLAFGSLLLAEATAALGRALGENPKIGAFLEIRQVEPAEGERAVFFN